MKKKSIFISICLLLFLGTLSYYAVVNMRSQSPRPEPFQPLTATEYQQLKQHLFSLIRDQNPRAAIESLKTAMDKDPRVMNECHEFLHEIGQESYKKYHNFAEAVKYQDEICVSGYIHGVIEAHFVSGTSLFDSVQTTCNDYPEGKFRTWECYHGIGHGLMYYTNNNVPLSLSMCKTLPTPFTKSACANGVYMENFNADTKLHPSQFLDRTDEFYPCDSLPDYKPDCYMNAPIHYLSAHAYNFDDAFNWCASADPAFQPYCFFGLTSQMSRRNMKNPKLVEQTCMKKSPQMISSCIGGIVSWYVSYNANLGQAKTVCQQVEKENQVECENNIKRFEGQFSEGR